MTERVATDVVAFLPVARHLCVEAGKIVMSLRDGPLNKERKPDNSLVTGADHAANDLLRKGLRMTFPAHALLSEETGFEGPTNAVFTWLVDPLDGTRAYAKGVTGFSVMVGLLFEGKPVLGVVYDPLEDDLYEAAQGHGAFHTRKGVKEPARVSARSRPAERTVVTSTGFPEAVKASLAPSFPGPWLEPVNSVGVKVGRVVRGLADVYINHHPVHLWDTAGPLAILEEAGGVMTHWDGAPLRYNLSGDHTHPAPTVATNGHGHQDIVKVLSSLPKK